MISKSILFSLSIQTLIYKNYLENHWFYCCLPCGRLKILLPFALILSSKVMKNKLFFFKLFSRYKEFDATTTYKYDPRTILNWVLPGTLKKKPIRLSGERGEPGRFSKMNLKITTKFVSLLLPYFLNYLHSDYIG